MKCIRSATGLKRSISLYKSQDLPGRSETGSDKGASVGSTPINPDQADNISAGAYNLHKSTQH